jgi:hypothetical protein
VALIRTRRDIEDAESWLVALRDLRDELMADRDDTMVRSELVALESQIHAIERELAR